MYADVIPFARLPLQTTVFTYAIPPELVKTIRPGSFVKISFRKKTTFGVIFSIHNTKPTKFTPLPIIEVLSAQASWTQKHLMIISHVSQYYITSLGTIASVFGPSIPTKASKSFRERILTVPMLPSNSIQKSVPAAIQEMQNSGETSISVKFQHHGERLLLYRQLISKNSKQTLIVTPEKLDAEEIYTFLIKYFPVDQIFLWQNDLSKHKQWLDWQEAKSARVLITNKSGLLLPYEDIGLIILDQEDSSFHKQWEAQPRYHNAVIANIIQKQFNCKLVKTSLSPTLQIEEQLHRLPSTPSNINVLYLDEKKNVFHPKLAELMEDDDSGDVLIICMQKSMYQTIMCMDCHKKILCQQCQSPVQQRGQKYLCLQCDFTQNITITCPSCHGTNLKHYGHGIESLANEAKKLAPDKFTQIITSDADALKPSAKTAQIVFTTPYIWKKHLSLIKASFKHVIFHHPEQMLFSPDYQANYLLYQMINWHRSTSLDYLGIPLTIQTSLPHNDETIQDVLKDDYEHFANKEKANRQILKYPPYSDLINLIKAQEDELDTEKNALKMLSEAICSESKVISQQGPFARKKGANKMNLNLIIKCHYQTPKNIDIFNKKVYNNIIIDINPKQLF